MKTIIKDTFLDGTAQHELVSVDSVNKGSTFQVEKSSRWLGYVRYGISQPQSVSPAWDDGDNTFSLESDAIWELCLPGGKFPCLTRLPDVFHYTAAFRVEMKTIIKDTFLDGTAQHELVSVDSVNKGSTFQVEKSSRWLGYVRYGISHPQSVSPACDNSDAIFSLESDAIWELCLPGGKFPCLTRLPDVSHHTAAFRVEMNTITRNAFQTEQRSTDWYLWTQSIRAQLSKWKRVRDGLGMFATEYRSFNLLAQPVMMATLHSAWKAMQPGGKAFQVENFPAG
ncbi:hypothetical protein OR573_15510 [Halomonas sp. CH40]